ncbi:hypothetical protein [Actinacidiphila sp. bgisy167]|uniref:hypothetical protein n=1 Tax=Actinacidiphila sp. bgisy167 TaxID=3413797 RepID=UPI003D75ECD7
MPPLVLDRHAGPQDGQRPPLNQPRLPTACRPLCAPRSPSPQADVRREPDPSVEETRDRLLRELRGADAHDDVAPLIARADPRGRPDRVPPGGW